MRNCFLTVIFVLFFTSCEIDDLSGNSIILFNFSREKIVEISAYKDRFYHSEGSYGYYVGQNLLYTFAINVSPGDLHVFEIPEGHYYFEVKTETGESFLSKEIYHTGILFDQIVFSVDYEVLEYDSH
jgi:hypothetical protein